MSVQKIHVAHLKHSSVLLWGLVPHPSGKRWNTPERGVRTSEHLLDVGTEVQAAVLWNTNFIIVKSAAQVPLQCIKYSVLCTFCCYSAAICVYLTGHEEETDSFTLRSLLTAASVWLEALCTIIRRTKKLIITPHHNSTLTSEGAELITQERQDRCMWSSAE